MGACIHCGQSAGLLRSVHKECQNNYDAARSQLLALAVETAHSGQGLEALPDRLASIASANRIPPAEIYGTLVHAFETVVDRSLEDGVLSAEEEQGLTAFAGHNRLAQVDLDARGAYTRMVMAGTLRDLFEGRVPDRMTLTGGHPFNLQKSESLIWLFSDVGYAEERTQRTYVGRSQGVSIKIAKGVYYRVGQSKGQAVETSQLQFIESGMLAVTTRHVYFGGTRKSFRIPFRKMVSVQPYSDGICIHRDAASARPQVFMVRESWFLYNLLMNLAQDV